MYYYHYKRFGTMDKLERISLPEMSILYYLKEFNIAFEKTYEVYPEDINERGRTIDFYLYELNLAVEYDGKLYH